ncbi:restriction endonuclease subunit S [Leclercia adecarboxylata]|nr:restriction endonuclease subunit S [Leclercia adecarboxylata]MBK0351738.1 restriction endonuclease subunit S [Leclercia adecarboxylata]
MSTVEQVEVRKYQPYSEYKNSGVEWLGNIPQHWSLSRVKDVAVVFGGYPFDSRQFNHDIGVPLVRIRDINSESTAVCYDGNVPKEAVIDNGDVLIGMDGEFNVSRWKGQRAVLNQRVACVRTASSTLTAYMYYALPFNLKLVNDLTYYTTVKHLSLEGIDKTLFALPSDKELCNIISFLDYETDRIDKLIAQQQRLIELLKEKRQAVISHAVTKGLNPDTPMKDSGVEWLGVVPKHWRVCRLKHVKSSQANSFVDGPFGSNLKSEHFVENGDVYVIESNFATTGELVPLDLKTVTNEHFKTIQRSSTVGGDIIIAKIGARFGSSAILPELDKAAVVSGNSLKLSVNPSIIDVEYANHVFQHLKREGAVDDGANITAQPALSLGTLNNLCFVVPPLKEQHIILLKIKNETKIYDGLLDKAGQFIKLIQERRTALISAAITGKIDLRGWTAPVQESAA